MKYARIVFATALYIVCNPSAFAQEISYPDWFKASFLDLPADLVEANDADRHLVLVFHQDGCPYCQALVERNFSQPSIIAHMQQSFDAVALNMWGDIEVVAPNGEDMSEKALAEFYKVQFTPTLLFLDSVGSVRLRLNGFVRPPVFQAALDYVSEGVNNPFGDYVTARLSDEDSPIARDDLLQFQPENLVALTEEAPFALLFEQEDCLDCRVLHDEVLSNDDTRSLLARLPTAQLDRFSSDRIIGLGGETTTPKKLAAALNISFTPTWVIFDNDGEEIIRMESSLRNFHVQAAMEYALDQVYQREPSFQRYINERVSRFRDEGKEINITQ